MTKRWSYLWLEAEWETASAAAAVAAAAGCHFADPPAGPPAHWSEISHKTKNQVRTYARTFLRDKTVSEVLIMLWALCHARILNVQQ